MAAGACGTRLVVCNRTRSGASGRRARFSRGSSHERPELKLRWSMARVPGTCAALLRELRTSAWLPQYNVRRSCRARALHPQRTCRVVARALLQTLDCRPSHLSRAARLCLSCSLSVCTRAGGICGCSADRDQRAPGSHRHDRKVRAASRASCPWPKGGEGTRVGPIATGDNVLVGSVQCRAWPERLLTAAPPLIHARFLPPPAFALWVVHVCLARIPI